MGGREYGSDIRANNSSLYSICGVELLLGWCREVLDCPGVWETGLILECHQSGLQISLRRDAQLHDGSEYHL